MCSSICKCIGCKNFEESPERKTLMHLADAAEVRVQQQTAAKTKLSSQISDLLTRTTPVISSGGGRYYSSFFYLTARNNILNDYCSFYYEMSQLKYSNVCGVFFHHLLLAICLYSRQNILKWGSLDYDELTLRIAFCSYTSLPFRDLKCPVHLD